MVFISFILSWKVFRVLVKAPYGTTERTVQEFLLSKKDWITKHLEKQNRQYVGPFSL